MQTTTTHFTAHKHLKRQKGLGKLNRLIASAQAKLRTAGYDMRRFSRNYETGTATSTCKRTGAHVTVNINGKTEQERYMGDAFLKAAQ